MPLPDKIKSAFDCTVCIVLSNNLILESTVKLVILTVPLPPGVKFKSAFELVAIVLSLKVILSTVIVPVSVVEPVVVNDASVVNPEVTPNVLPIVTAPVSVCIPAIFAVPSTIKFSLMLIVDESAELNVVPENSTEPNTTDPVPAGVIFISSFDLVDVMSLSENCSAPKVIFPVPDGVKTISSFDLQD